MSRIATPATIDAAPAASQPLLEGGRKDHWPLGRRPDEHPSLSELGL
jgi:nuclear transport factor 2 (NTF2) superfamily protein